MALVRLSSHSLANVTQINGLVYRIRSAINQYILRDLKLLFQPGQAPGPLIIAVALGTILSFIPAPVVDSLLVGVIFARYRQINRTALLAARIVWNDLIVVPLYVPGFRLGMRFLEPFFVNETAITVRIIAFMVGLVALTSAATLISTAIMLCFIKVLQKWQATS